MKPVYWFVSEVNPRNAGYRVRTLPIVNELRAQGLSVELRPLAELPTLVKELAATAMAVVVSKPSDATTQMCMQLLATQHVPVVVDLFDNYFSWSPSLAKRQLHWQWMRTLQLASLVICSSGYLLEVIRSLTDKPVIEVGDEVPRIGADRLGDARFERKWQRSGRFELLWFGISGNPYYLAGLEDLVRWSDQIRALIAQLGDTASVRLTICTNRVSAVDAVLADMRTHQIEARFVEWTEEVCDALLDAAHVVLLPTNLSGFSLSKTHNRCSDALLSGCLVLCSPNGPYRDISGAVIDDPELLGTVLKHTNAAGVQALIDASFAKLRQRHDLVGDVSRFSQALLAARTAAVRALTRSSKAPKVVVVARIKSEATKFARTIDYLVAAFADGPWSLNCDFQLKPLAVSGGRPTVALSERGWAVVEDALARNVVADLQDYDDRIECRIGGWRIRLDRSLLELVVLEGLDEEQVAALHRAQRDGRGTNSTQFAAWFRPHVDMITKILWHVGLRDIDMATEDEGGWDEFVANADPALAAINQRLQASWVRFRGNELAWGRQVVGEVS